MEKNIVVISHSGRNYSAYLPELPGCVSVGDTLEEVKGHIAEAVTGHVAASVSDGDFVPASFLSSYELDYKLTPSAALQAYKEIIPFSGVARLTGINQRQVQHYASGLKTPRSAQIKKIESALHQLGRELLAVDLYN